MYKFIFGMMGIMIATLFGMITVINFSDGALTFEEDKTIDIVVINKYPSAYARQNMIETNIGSFNVGSDNLFNKFIIGENYTVISKGHNIINIVGDL